MDGRMPKTLTSRQLDRKPDGIHRAAPNLYLQIRGGSRVWFFRHRLAGKPRYMSLGSLEFVTMDEAMAAAATARVQVRLQGVDVLAERRIQRAEQRTAIIEAQAQESKPARKSGHTFGELLDVAADAEAKAKAWKPGPTVKVRWISPITRYCTALVSKDVTAITEAMVVDCLKPHWETNNTMATRTLGRVIYVMGHARRLGWIEGDNPIVLERAKEKLPRVGKAIVRHHPVMPIARVPGFMVKLAEDDSDLAQLFRVLVLTGVRANEAAGMSWSEIDLHERVWTIPGGSPKSRLNRWQHGDHRVPLADGVVAILEARQASAPMMAMVSCSPTARCSPPTNLPRCCANSGFPRAKPACTACARRSGCFSRSTAPTTPLRKNCACTMRPDKNVSDTRETENETDQYALIRKPVSSNTNKKSALALRYFAA